MTASGAGKEIARASREKVDPGFSRTTMLYSWEAISFYAFKSNPFVGTLI
ncbi:MAG: hypothetical protein KDJ29_14405 [Hyphomicrobiales bacterium]|nr:hypothetical protein [Hyphomicrobiales bacterium]